MTSKIFSITNIASTDMQRMHKGDIMVFCEVCKKPTWHIPIKPFPSQLTVSKHKRYTAEYKCTQCRKKKVWTIRNSY